MSAMAMSAPTNTTDAARQSAASRRTASRAVDDAKRDSAFSARPRIRTRALRFERESATAFGELARAVSFGELCNAARGQVNAPNEKFAKAMRGWLPTERGRPARTAALVDRASLSESGFSGLAGFSGFHFAQPALFAITGNPAKTNTDERMSVKDARQRIPKILILTRNLPLQDSSPSFPRKRESRRLQSCPPPEIKYK